MIILARRADEVDRIVGLEMGADDYLVKPLNSRELLARIRNILRRANGAARTPAARGRLFRFGGWQLDIVARELSRSAGKAGQTLRSSEYRVLALAARARQPRGLAPSSSSSRAAAMPIPSIAASTCASVAAAPDSRRRRARPRIIKTVHGEGYVIGVLVERG